MYCVFQIVPEFFYHNNVTIDHIYVVSNTSSYYKIEQDNIQFDAVMYK